MMANGDTTAAIDSLQRAVRLAPDWIQPRLDLGYALLAEDRPKAAIEQFEAALQLDPRQLEIQKQAGYVWIRLGEPQRAINRFLVADSLTEEITDAKLQLGYLYQEVGDVARATDVFREAAGASASQITAEAERAIANLENIGSEVGDWPASVYAAPSYRSRFENGIAPFVARAGPVLSTDPEIQMYGSLRATRDTRSEGGAAPQIFSDNTVIPALGARTWLTRYGPVIYAEAGPAIYLIERQQEVRLDVRSGVYGSYHWAPLTEGSLRFDPALAGDLYFDVSYYSRFDDNVIGYVQVRPGVRILRSTHAALDLIGVLQGAFDTNRLYFNNLIEAGIGTELHLKPVQNAFLRAEYVRGAYLVTSGAPEETYGDFRVTVVLSRYWADVW